MSEAAAARGGSVATRLRAIFLAILLVGVAASAFALVALQRVVDVVDETTGVVQPLDAAAYEMEINAIGMGMGVFKYLHAPHPSHIERIEEDARDFEHFQGEFERLASPGEPMAVAAEARRVFGRYRALGLALVDDKDVEQALAQELIEDVAELDLEGAVATKGPDLAAAPAWAALASFSAEASARILQLVALSPLDDSIDSGETAAALDRSRALIARLIARPPSQIDAAATDLALAQALHVADDIAVLEAAIQRIAADAAEFIRLRRAIDDLLDDRMQVYTAALIEQARRDLSATLGRAQVGVIAAAVLAIGLIATGSVYVARSVVRPIGLLVEGTERIAHGRADWRVAVTSRDEFGRLAEAFNAMADRISAHSRGLEDAVANRTVELAASESRLRTTLENLAEGVVVSDLDGRILDFNRAAVLMHDFSGPEEYLRLLPEFADTFELSAPDGTILPLDQWPLARVLRGEILCDLEVNVRRKRNGWRRVFGYGGTIARDADGQPLVSILTIRDLTESKQAEEKIRTQMQRAEALLESAPDPVVIADREGRIAIVNARTEAVFGYARAELIGRPVEMLLPERLHAAHVAHRVPYQEAPQARVMGAGRELLARRKDGSEFAVDVSLSPLETPEGTLIISTVRDVTERKQAESRIRGQLEHLNLLDHITRAIGERQDLKSIFQVVVRSLEDSLPIDFGCICLHDPAANTLRVTCVGIKSEALAHELTMDERASIDVDANGLGRCVAGQLVYEPDIGQVSFPFPARLARGGLRSLAMAPLRSESRVFGVMVAARREIQAFSSVECEFLRQLSEHVALAVHQAQLYGALQQAYDDLRQTQQAMMQEERLRALGQMASGIAHDINNALSPVSLYAESMLETEPNLSDRARGNLETIQRAVADVGQTVARMREFYRQRETQLELTPVAMNTMVQQVVDLTRARWSDMPLSRGIVIGTTTDLATDLPKVMGVESEIREALTNLVFNAVDAMPEGGTLTLRTRLADAGTQPAAVVVEVADSGIGMDEVTRQRCLEPFFTTKGERGTGLGLAMVFGMAQRHSAELEIESAPGAGTTVRLIFDVPAAVPVEPQRYQEAPQPPSRLRLLLVDDDPILLKSLRDALESMGHVIVTANGGEQGIATLRASLDRGEPFAAVITDLGMPYVDGRAVAAAVKQASPATPVIMLTGWGQRLVAEGDIPPHVDRVIAKPPKLRELREALAQLCRPTAS